MPVTGMPAMPTVPTMTVSSMPMVTRSIVRRVTMTSLHRLAGMLVELVSRLLWDRLLIVLPYWLFHWSMLLLASKLPFRSRRFSFLLNHAL